MQNPKVSFIHIRFLCMELNKFSEPPLIVKFNEISSKIVVNKKRAIIQYCDFVFKTKQLLQFVATSFVSLFVSIIFHFLSEV